MVGFVPSIAAFTWVMLIHLGKVCGYAYSGRGLVHRPSLSSTITRLIALRATALDDFRDANVLVVGDGDFSFARSLSEKRLCRSLVATTIDSPDKAKSAFPRSAENIQAIEKAGYHVKFEVDATAITTSFGSQRFDLLVWNFPHIIGKQNIRYNRQLLTAFLRSAGQAVTDSGKVKIALCEGQSGCGASNKVEWDRSWKLAAQAAEAHLLITNIQSFDTDLFEGYSQQGHRGHGGTFAIGKAKQFDLQRDGENRRGQQCVLFTHELHLVFPTVHPNLLSLEDEVRSAIIRVLGEKSEALWTAFLVDLYPCPSSGLLSHVFQISYASLSRPFSREEADNYRIQVEALVPQLLGMKIREGKAGWKISQPYGWYVAQRLQAAPATKDIKDILHDGLDTQALSTLPSELRRLDEADLGNSNSNSVEAESGYSGPWRRS
eukprot:gene2732-2983_t